MSTKVSPGVENQVYHGGDMKVFSPLDTMRHSAAHIMASAVLEMFPDAKFAYGPPIENGFYYDFELPRSLTPEDFPEIEKRMRRLIESGEPFVREEISRERALEMFADQPYKVETINLLPENETISIYTVGPFTDLCRGPHVENSGRIGPVKLLSLAAAYWRGDENRPQLQRLYATAWPTQGELDEYLWRLEEARKRDHRKIGKDLDLFMVSEQVGGGLVLWLPKGATIRRELENFIVRAEQRAGYKHVYTPHIGKIDLYKTSGHWQHYRDSMYSPIEVEEEEYILRPMNCPHHIVAYKHGLHSYRELPIRLAELGTVYRYEKSGELTGMSRVRGFTINDAHIFCRPDQLREEFVRVVELIQELYHAVGFRDYVYRVSLRDPADTEKYVGGDEMWAVAEDAIRDALDSIGAEYVEAVGEAAFYGPKLDVMVRDVLGREFAASTNQVDLYLPEAFELEYVDADGSRKRPAMIHRAPIGSLERFFAFLTEQHAGAFPVWLSPVQAVVIPIADRHTEYAEEVAANLRGEDIRVEVDARSERMQHKIREAQLQKVPYMLVVGDREREAGAAAVRLRSGEDLKAQPISEVLRMITKDIKERR
ncbi:MAG: threonine--tRNA ligase [Chloroflexota bacterium]|nr:threonine--tRNA ligase [Chloroflexota bacterium]